MTGFPTFLTILLALPLVGFVIVAATPRKNETFMKWTAFFFSLISFVVSLFLLAEPFSRIGDYLWAGRVDWIPAANISYALGVDGMSILLVLLTTLLSPISILSSWSAIEDRVKEYYAFIDRKSTRLNSSHQLI